MAGEDRCLILFVEEDQEDQYLAKIALADNPLADSIVYITSLSELSKYLQHLQQPGRLLEGGGTRRPVLILLYSYLPVNALVEVIDEIHAVLGKDVPIAIMVTSENEKAYIEELVHPDVAGYLIKPVTVDKLGNLMATII